MESQIRRNKKRRFLSEVQKQKGFYFLFQNFDLGMQHDTNQVTSNRMSKSDYTDINQIKRKT